jgi:hypothetical protein
VGPRAALEGCEKSCPTGFRSPDLPVRSESLYFRAAVIATVHLGVICAPGANLTTRRIMVTFTMWVRSSRGYELPTKLHQTKLRS